jgi:8-oxo-dGTP pyrophosphatase MutT (NUDIX family)
MTRRLEELRAVLGARPPRRDAPEGVSRAAVAVVLAPGFGAAGGELELLLIRRAEREDDPWSGHMALPGGREDPGDATLLETALREVREEVGIELGRAALLGELDDLRPVSAPARIVVRPFVFGLVERPRLTLSNEVAGSLWTSLRALREATSSTELVHLGRMRRMPCYRLGEDVVWGMTKRILEPYQGLDSVR